MVVSHCTVHMIKILHMHVHYAYFHTIPTSFNSPASAPASYFQDYTNKVRKFLSNKQSWYQKVKLGLSK